MQKTVNVASTGWGLKRDISPCFGARLVQEGCRVHYLADRVSFIGQFSEADLRHLDQAFPLLMKQLELMLTSGELNPRYQHSVTLYAKGLTCEADTLGSCGYLYICVYPTPATSHCSHASLLFNEIKPMQISSLPSMRAAPTRPSPVEIWTILLTYLLENHYGLALNDTPFSDETVIQQHIDAGITLADAVNFVVEKYGLVRTDRKGFSWQEQSPYLRAVDILRARQATGLLRRRFNLPVL